MASLQQLMTWRDSLMESRMSGVREVRDQNGEAIVFKSDSEMRGAIAAADSEISRLSGGRPNTILFNTSKGI